MEQETAERVHSGWQLTLFFTALALVGAQHVAGFLQGAELVHLADLIRDLYAMAQGSAWVQGPELAETGVAPGGPMYVWLHTPGRLLHDPVLGIHGVYLAWELLAVLLWALAARRGVLSPAAAWTGLILLVGMPRPALALLENGTIAGLLVAAGFALGLVVLQRPRVGWSLLAGVLFGAAIQCHLFGLLGLLALGGVVLLQREHRLRRLLGLLVGAGLVVALCVPGMDLTSEAGGTDVSFGFAQLVPGLLSAVTEPAVRGLIYQLFQPWWLALPGLAAAVWMLVRGGPGRAGAGFVLAWFGLYVLISLPSVTQVSGAYDADVLAVCQDRMARMVGLSAPARAALMGLALWLAFALCRRWVPPVRRLPEVALPLVAALVLGGLAGVSLRGAAAEPSPEPLTRYTSTLQHSKIPSRDAAWIIGLLRSQGVQGPPPRTPYVGPDHIVELLGLWQLPWLRGEERSRIADAETFILPLVEPLDAAGLPGLRPAGAIALLPRCTSIGMMRKGDTITFRWPPNLGARDRVVVTLGPIPGRDGVPELRISDATTLWQESLGLPPTYYDLRTWAVVAPGDGAGGGLPARKALATVELVGHRAAGVHARACHVRGR